MAKNELTLLRKQAKKVYRKLLKAQLRNKRIKVAKHHQRLLELEIAIKQHKESL